MLGDVEPGTDVCEVSGIGDGLVGDGAHAGDLFFACGQGVLEDFAETAGAAVWGVVWSGPEGDWFDGAGTDGKVLLDEELVLA